MENKLGSECSKTFVHQSAILSSKVLSMCINMDTYHLTEEDKLGSCQVFDIL